MREAKWCVRDSHDLNMILNPFDAHSLEGRTKRKTLPFDIEIFSFFLLLPLAVFCRWLFIYYFRPQNKKVFNLFSAPSTPSNHITIVYPGLRGKTKARKWVFSSVAAAYVKQQFPKWRQITFVGDEARVQSHFFLFCTSQLCAKKYWFGDIFLNFQKCVQNKLRCSL